MPDYHWNLEEFFIKNCDGIMKVAELANPEKKCFE